MRKGEEIVVPGSILRANMFLTRGASFSQRGVDWLARLLFAKPIGMVPVEPKFETGLVELADEAESILAACPLLREIDRSTPEGVAAASKILSDNPIDPGLMALFVHTKAHMLLEYLRSDSQVPPTTVAATAWSAGVAASLLRFKIAFEEAAYRGHSFEKIRRLVSEWSKNQTNDSEKFWQDLLLANPFALSQLFAAPVVIHGERYLVGGIRAGGKHGKFADYLLRNQLTDAAIIVEIKTPCTPLLYANEYRNDVFVPSRELSGAVQQTLEQRAQFMKHMQTLQGEQEAGEPRVEVIEPHCVVIAGNTKRELTTRALRRSFESYRTELRSIRIVTFDELFAKLSGLAGLLGARDLDGQV
ncbi:MAG TPA: Shedu immune nuclease family protein [Polyangiaceae bacterium]|nr:Shedu immune nuclease family protein [Polyangiaceae bacterium]